MDAVAEQLRNDPVYVDPVAERELSESEIEDVREAIGEAWTPIYIAVLPADAADGAGGDPAEVARQLSASVGRPGTYGVIVGDSFRAGSSELPTGQAGELAVDALESGGDDTAAVLVDFVGLVSAAAADAESGGSDGSSGSSDDGGSSILLPVLLVGGAGAAGLWAWRSSQKRKAAAAERARAEEADRQMLRAELSVLADDVVRLEPEVELHPDARSDFDAAVSRYRAAQAALDYADQPVDLVRAETRRGRGPLCHGSGPGDHRWSPAAAAARRAAATGPAR